MLREHEFFVVISDRDRLRVRYTADRNAVVEVVVQLECWLADGWIACRRYDSMHGYFHVHPRPWDTEHDRRMPVAVGDLADGLTLAIDDLKANWGRYRQALEAANRGARE